jgi:hypothetical protein
MKKEIYRIFNKDNMASASRWLVDEFGLDYIRNHYENYDSHGETINRWGEFKVEKATFVNLDLGGMIDANEPKVIFRWNGCVCKIPLTHISYFKSMLISKEHIRPSGGWVARVWRWKWYFDPKTAFSLYKVLNRLENRNIEKSREYHEKFMKNMQKMKGTGIIIS